MPGCGQQEYGKRWLVSLSTKHSHSHTLPESQRAADVLTSSFSLHLRRLSLFSGSRLASRRLDWSALSFSNFYFLPAILLLVRAPHPWIPRLPSRWVLIPEAPQRDSTNRPPHLYDEIPQLWAQLSSLPRWFLKDLRYPMVHQLHLHMAKCPHLLKSTLNDNVIETWHFFYQGFLVFLLWIDLCSLFFINF